MTLKYSVLMSVYAGEEGEFFAQSIASILAQTLPPAEFVIVCDGPLTPQLNDVIATHESSEIFRIIRIEKNVGLAEALQTGLAHCQNEYIARMDSDDISAPKRIERQLALLERDGLDIVGCTVEEFFETPGDLQTLRKVPETLHKIRKFARRRNPFNHPSIVYKKSTVFAAGGYEKFPLCEDYHLWVKMLRRGATAANIPEPLVFMRTGSGMYNRRGGWKYFKTMLRFRRWLRQIGFSGNLDFLYCMAGHLVSCFAPNFLRRWMYIGFFRTQNSNDNSTRLQ